MKKMKPFKGYTATVEFDADEMVLHGRIDNIRDVVTFHSTSVEQLQSMFEEAVEDYLDLCETRGEQPEKPFSGRFVLRVEPELHRQIAIRAASQGKSLNAWVVAAVSAELNSAEELSTQHVSGIGSLIRHLVHQAQAAKPSATYRVEAPRAIAPEFEVHHELLKFSKAQAAPSRRSTLRERSAE